MKPLRVSAALASPVLSNDFTLPLDGILLALALERQLGPPPALAPGQFMTYDRALLPLARVADDTSYWFYAASFAVWERAYSDDTYAISKRFDLNAALLHSSAKRVEVDKGRYKLARRPFRGRHAPEVAWYVVGDQGALQDLLTPCLSIGKKRQTGWGAVREWRVEAWEEDTSVWRDGELMRAVPKAYVPGRVPNASVAYTAFRPPYWQLEHVQLCLVPRSMAW
jgi:CRISPR type IV-associated protein Csf3